MNKEILKLAIPNILSNVSVPLIGSVDTSLMGFEDQDAYLAAIGSGGMIFNFLYWGFGFLRMGTTGMTAQAFGRKDQREKLGIFLRGMVVAFAVALIFLVFQVPLENIGMYLVGADADTAPIISRYFDIRILAAPAVFGLMVLFGWYFGMQNAVFPLILTLIINFSNIGISWYLVKERGMDIEGVAWGTVIAQYLGFISGLILFQFKYKGIWLQENKVSLLRWNAMKSFFTINRDIFLRTICLIVAFGFFYNRSAAFGVAILGINNVLQQLVSWMSYGIDGFAYASESLVGKYLGAGDKASLKKSIKLSFIWGAVFAILYSLVYFFFGNEIITLFTDKENIIALGETYIIWLAIFPILSFASYIWDGIFIGYTASRSMRDTMFLSMLAFLLSYACLSQFGNHGLWAALCVYVVARAILQWIWFYWNEELTISN